MTDLPPEIAHENAINDLIEKYSELKLLTAAIMVRRDEAAAQVEEGRAELDRLEGVLGRAVEGDQDDEALALLQQRHDTEDRLAGLVTELEQAQADAGAAKDSLVELKQGIERLKAERPRAVSAAASVSLDEQLDGIAVDAELIALENAREHIQNTIALVDLNRELAGSELGVTAVPREDPEAKARRQLEELKRLRGGGEAPTSKKRL